MLSKNKTIRCPACHGENSIDSRFCRNCGRPLVEDAVIAAENLTSPAEIDARRARQLLERALHLAEKGDYPSATLACRQAVALDHDFFDGYAMLGSLLERQHDTKGAINAFERALQIAPDSVLESESLSRLRASSAVEEKGSGFFQFDQEELAPVVPPLAEPIVTELAVSEVEDEALLPSFEEVETPAIGVRLPPTSQSLLATSEEVAEETATVTELTPETTVATFAMPASGVSVNLPPSRSAAEIAADSNTTAESKTASAATVADVSAVTALASAAVAARGADAQPITPSSDDAPDGEEGVNWAFDRPNFDETMFPRVPVTPLAAAAATIPGLEDAAANEANAPAKAPVSLAAPLEIRASTHTIPLPHNERHMTPVAPVAARPAQPRQKSDKAETLRAPGVLPLAFTFGTEPTAKLPWWAPVVRGQSFYGRTLPLVALAVLSLGFLGWARGHALSNQAEAAPVVVSQDTSNQQGTVPGTTQPNFVNPATSTTTNTNTNTVPGAATSNPNQGGFVITNQPATTTPANGTTTPANTGNQARPTQNTTPRTGNRSSTGGGGNNPSFPPVTSVPPADPSTLAPAKPSGGSGDSGGNFGNLGAPRVNRPSPEPTPVIVLPPSVNTGNDSMGGNSAPVNPSGSSAAERGYIRITQGQIPASNAPRRPENRARDDERAAANAARTGNADRAIDGFTTALNRNTPNAGYLFQQRAMAFMQRGDSARAAEDFQSSISAYQDQINRGENVTDARAGLRASRNGLTLALANNG